MMCDTHTKARLLVVTAAVFCLALILAVAGIPAAVVTSSRRFAGSFWCETAFQVLVNTPLWIVHDHGA